MKRAISERDMLIEELAQYFRLKPEKLSYAETIEMLSVYRYVVRFHEVSSIDEVFETLQSFNAPTPGRSRRKRLYQLYIWCQAKSLVAEGYDTTTLHTPIPTPWHENYY